jgi:hypothetical protein
VGGVLRTRPDDFRTETLDVLTRIGEEIPGDIELGYHLCYGSPADEHLVQPKDAGLMVEMANEVSARVARPIRYFTYRYQGTASTTIISHPWPALSSIRDRALSRPHSSRRCGRRSCSACRSTSPQKGRRCGHRMRHGPR